MLVELSGYKVGTDLITASIHVTSTPTRQLQLLNYYEHGAEHNISTINMAYAKRDEDAEGSIFANIDRTTVFQEARIFNQSPISPRQCRVLLTKIIYLLSIGEHFSTHESTDLFFGMTKLFQHKDVSRTTGVY